MNLQEKLKAEGLTVLRGNGELLAEEYFGKIAKAIVNSKVVISCITKAYFASHNCNLEFNHAYCLSII